MNRILSILFLVATASSFAPSSSVVSTTSQNNINNILVSNTNNRLQQTIPSPSISSATALSEGRQWNFNNGRSPWGLKKNAEIWNGRVAQMAFVIVLLQEAITGKGVVAAINDGDLVGYAFLGLAGVSTLGSSIWLAIKGDESDIIF